MADVEQHVQLQQELDCKIQSLEAELTECRCRESRLVDDQANAAVSAHCLKVTELEKLVDQQACQLDRLNAEGQVNCCSL